MFTFGVYYTFPIKFYSFEIIPGCKEKGYPSPLVTRDFCVRRISG